MALGHSVPVRQRLHAPAGERGSVPYDFYIPNTQRSKTSPFLFVLLHGWLGSETLQHAAAHVAMHGHDVAVPVHDHSFHVRNFLQPNKRRSQDAHLVTKHASRYTGKKQVIIIDHSNGNQDALHMTEHVAKTKPDYRIHAIGALAGVGMNGHAVSPLAFVAETIEHAKLLAKHPREDLRVVGRSALNFLRNPILAVEEGVVASVIACKHAFVGLQQQQAVGEILEVYFDRDALIPPPKQHTGLVLPGSHMTPVVEPDIVAYVAERLVS